MAGSSFGYGDALRQQIDILLRTGGTEDVDQLKDSVVQLNAVMVTTATVMRDAGASAEEIAAAIRPIANDIRNVMRGVDEFSRSTQASAEVKQRAAQLIIEADEGIARAEAMAWAAGEEAARKRDAEAGRTEWLTKQVDGLSNALEAMHAHEQTAAAATRTTTAAVEGQGVAVGRTQEEIDRQNRRAAYSFLQLGRVIDDMQYVGEQGLRPIINNIMEFNPKIGMALVAFELLRKAGADELRALGREFGLLDDPVHKFISSIQDAKDRLEALTAKKHKIQVDYEQIEQATRQLDRMEKNLRAFEAHRETAAQKDMAKQAVDVIERFVGGTPELEKAIYESRKVAGVSSGSGKDEMELARLRKVQQGLSGRDDLSFEERAQAKELARMIAEIEARVEVANKAFAKDEAGAVARGDEGAVKRVQNLARDFPGRFKAGAAQHIADLPSTQEEAERRAEVLRSAHEAISDAQTDDDVTPGEKAQAIADQVNRLAAIPGEAGRKAHEAAKRALAAARKAYEQEVKQAEEAAEKMAEDIAKEQAKKEDEDPADAFNQNQIDTDVWLTTIKPQRDARRKAEAKAAKQADVDARKVDAAEKREANKLDDPFIGKVQAEMVENMRRINAGQPVAHDLGTFQTQTQMGMMPALDPDVLGAWQAQRIGHDLGTAGRNPALAGRVVQTAREGLQEKIAGAASRTAATGDTVVDNQRVLAQIAENLMHQAARTEAKANAVGAQLQGIGARLRGNRGGGLPTLQNTVRPGP